MWTTEHSVMTTARPEQIWALYADPTTWPRWDDAAAAVTLDGPFRAGTRGRLTPVRGPAADFVLTEVVPEVAFADVTALPLARLTFEHRIEVLDDGRSRVTQRATITGATTPLFSRLIGRGIAAGMPTAMANLVALAGAATSATTPG